MSRRPQLPVMLVGMHRSGTSILARLLGEAGLFLGATVDDHWEAPFFRELNDWLLSQAEGTWDHPGDFRYLLEHGELRAAVTDYLRYFLTTRHAVSFLGWKRFLGLRDVAALEIPWAFKDPRTSLTLPLWQDVFPGSPVLSLVRHGVDVARSLTVRYSRRFRVTARRDRFWRYWIRPKRGRFSNSKVTQVSMEYNFGLWERYVADLRTFLDASPGPTLEVRYEDLLAEPTALLPEILEFCGLKAPASLVERLAGELDRGRAFAFREDEGLVEFSRSVEGRLAAYGY